LRGTIHPEHKPCPWCGGPPILYVNHDEYGGPMVRVAVQCSNPVCLCDANPSDVSGEVHRAADLLELEAEVWAPWDGAYCWLGEQDEGHDP
jgi:hypothetical protein